MGVSESMLSAISIAGEDLSPASSEALETGPELLSELTSYLGKLGLGANHLAKLFPYCKRPTGRDRLRLRKQRPKQSRL